MVAEEFGKAEIVAPVASVVFGYLVPLSILLGRYAVRRNRQIALENLRRTFSHTSGRDASLIASFEHALQKYDLDKPASKGFPFQEVLFYLSTAFIFMSTSAIGMVLLIGHANPGTPDKFRFMLSGIQTVPVDALQKQNYELETGAVIAFAFLGAYIWSIQYLIRRIANFDLSPMSFLRVTGQVILACATATVLRHTLPISRIPSGWQQTVLLAAFIVGFFPNAGLDYLIQKLPQLRVKRLDPDAPKAFRAMPVDMIDGIDSQVSFRLAEQEIVDIENLATQNPILLCTETPYSLLQVIDWIAQAQLVLEVGPKAYCRLRDLGLRTVFALENIQGDPQLEATALKVLYGDSDRPTQLARRIAAMKANLHVKRLYEIYQSVQSAMVAEPSETEIEPAPRTILQAVVSKTT